MSNQSFQQLKSLLEGKTIAKIEEPNASEAICKFVLTDGSAFRLHATDLGFWIENTVASPNVGYETLTELINDYYHHCYADSSFQPKLITILTNKLIISAPDNKEFVIDLSKLDNTEFNIIKTPDALEIFESALPLGNVWKILFTKKNASELPENCLFK